MTRAIAFYLPQYHPIPENNLWWGDGFTEWSNVKTAQPLYEGHYQPHKPLNDNYYTLLDVNTQRQQVNLAKTHGIYGFCFYFYWFNGKTLLETPLINWRQDKSLDMPFCLCWANENWTRRWDGLDNEILIRQQYSPKDDRNFIQHVIQYIKDPRYIRINNRPLVIVYRPGLLPNPRFTAKQWRYECRKADIGEIYIAYVQSFDQVDPNEIGFDAAIEFPPITSQAPATTHHYNHESQENTFQVYQYEDIASYSEKKYHDRLSHQIFPGICPAWDNTARRRNNGASIIHGSSPQRYEEWLRAARKAAKARAGDNPDLDIVFINAWNEWGEGCHLEPDQKYGLSYLEASRNALENGQVSTDEAEYTQYEQQESKGEIETFAIVIHAFYLDVLEQLIPDIEKSSGLGIKLYVTCPIQNQEGLTRILSHRNLEYEIFACENRGRDILPFLSILPSVIEAGHPYLIKIHTKKTLHRSDGARWLNELTNDLIGMEALRDIKTRFDENGSLGIIGPSGNVLPTQFYLGSNLYHIRQLLNRLEIEYEDFLNTVFVAGSMFAARTKALIPLSDLQLTAKEFEDESGQVDGTIAHALERIVSVSASKLNYQTESVDKTVTHDFQYAVHTEIKDAQKASERMGYQLFNPVELPPGIISEPHPQFMGWIDYPNEGESLRGCTDISGWCFHAEEEIEAIKIWIGNKLIKSADYGHERNDILEVYHQASTSRVGFNAHIDLTDFPELSKGSVGHIHLEVITASHRFLGLTKAIILPNERSAYLSYLLTRSTSYHKEKKLQNAVSQSSLGVRTICFYLPQFHAIPENDAWWGKGFTEWVNVAQGLPLFVGHEQPRIPADLGFYDLANPEHQLRQIALAQHYGIEGFCYYIYWFGGRRLLELPTERLLTDSRFTAPFCLCWANENWSRRWDGGDSDLLMEQNYSPEDDVDLINEMARYFKLENYIRVDGKPVFLVYNIDLLPDPLGTTQRWRDTCRKLGIGEIYLAMCHSFTGEVPSKVGFDAAVEFPPLRFPCERMEYKLDIGDPSFPGKIYDWMSLVHNHIARSEPEEYVLHPSLVLGWDNVARKGVRGHIFHGANPKTFGEWAHAISRRRLLGKPHDSRLLFINAWNEWAEGTYLEPDRRHGYGYLNSLVDGLSSALTYGPSLDD
jgi:lipopolysaccharide biosynthesis protein